MSYRKIMLAALAGAAISAHADSSLADSSKVHDIDEVVIVSQPKEVFRLRNQPLSSTSVGSFEIRNP